MIIRGTPKNTTDFIEVSSRYTMTRLQEEGFMAEYIDNQYAYFRIDVKLINALIRIIDEAGENYGQS
jgi:hypothetical protein